MIEKFEYSSLWALWTWYRSQKCVISDGVLHPYRYRWAFIPEASDDSGLEVRRQGTHQREFKPYVVRLAKLLRKRAKVSCPPSVFTRLWNNEDKWLCYSECSKGCLKLISSLLHHFPPSIWANHFFPLNNQLSDSSSPRKIQKKTVPLGPCLGSQVTSCWPSTWSAAWSSCFLSSTCSARCSTARPAAAQVPPTPTTPQTPPSAATRRATNWRVRKCSGAELDRTSRRWWRKTF